MLENNIIIFKHKLFYIFEPTMGFILFQLKLEDDKLILSPLKQMPVFSF